MEVTKEVAAIQATPQKRIPRKEQVICEVPLLIVVNGKEVATLQCTPSSLEYLAVGFLLSEGVLTRREDVKRTVLADKGSHIRIDVVANVEMETLVRRRLIGSAGVSFYQRTSEEAVPRANSQFQISISKVLELMKQFQTKSSLYGRTRGNHSCALSNADGAIIVFAEDIGRHNAVDKVIGECVLRGVSLEDKILATTGRISAEIVNKIGKWKIPIIVSFGAPTSLALDLATNLGLTVIGFAREHQAVIYTNGDRVI